MKIIDADAHVIESVAMWSHLDPEFVSRGPVPILVPENTSLGHWNAFWLIDEKQHHFGAVPAIGKLAHEKGYKIDSQQLTPTKARLDDLDRLGIQQQILHPSCGLLNLAQDVELEAALMRSYNTFLSRRSAESGGRIWFDALVPWRRPDLAVAEIRRLREMGGAVSIMIRGLEWDKPISDPAFYPIYEEAERQNLAIVVHLGSGSPGLRRVFDGVPRIPGEDPFFPPRSKRLVATLTVQYAFYNLMETSLFTDFRKLRWAFLEGGGSEWVSAAINTLERGGIDGCTKRLDEGRLFFSCEPDENLGEVVSKLGEDALVVASDMPHFDESANANIRGAYESRKDVPSSALEKLLHKNATRLYSLQS